MQKLITLLFTFLCFTNLIGQERSFPQDPQEVQFVTSDIPNFWAAFDALPTATDNPFKSYIAKGSIGLQDFIPNRIMSADSLLRMVQRRKADYEKMRGIAPKIKALEKSMKPYFYALEYWYPDAVYPPVYFIVGRFNSGGTSSDNGLLIGAEMLTDLESLPELIIHESIHYQQKLPKTEEPNLLQKSVLEGMADFVAELVTGIKGNVGANTYGTAHKEDLCKEFVTRMYQGEEEDWLYGTSGKDDRPNDLGYWIGYEIVKAYFDKAQDKKQAVYTILNLEDYPKFLEESGYLDAYLKTAKN